MTRKATWLAIAAACGVGVIAISVASVSPRPESNGPLAGAAASGYAVAVPVGEVVTDAFTVLPVRNSSGDPIELLSIEQVYTEAGVESAGEWFAGLDRDRELLVHEQFYREAPPSDARLGTLVPIAGAEAYRDNDGFVPQLLLATRVTRSGHYRRDGLWITYTYAGRTYRDYLRSELTICTPDAVDEDGGCPFLTGDD